MGLAYRNLDSETRRYMIEEIDIDAANGSIFTGTWLSPVGASDFPGLLRSAAANGTDDSLAAQLRQNGRVALTAERRKPKGDGMVTYRVPDMAPDTIAESEFNRYYVRAYPERS